MRIMGGRLITAEGQEFENGYVDFKDGVITAFGDITEAGPAEGEVYDAEGGYIMPGFIDAHTHIGILEQNVRWEGNDVNEMTDPVTPHLDAIDGIYPFDVAFADAVNSGVTSAVVGPGSANVVGGTFVAIKLHGKRVDNMIIKNPIAMKCAFGENPKRCYGQGAKKSPMTRMGTAALLRELLFKTKRYLEDKQAGKNPPFDMKLESMIPVIEGKLPLKAHAHRADDILTSIRIAKEFGVKLTLDHCTDGALIADELAAENYPAFVGPTFGNKSKIELANKSFTTPKVLADAGVKVSIITDAPVIPLQYLPMCAALAVNAGLDTEYAWKAITINAAESTGISDRVGSLETGKDGDVVIWTADPMTTVGAESYTTIIDGKIVYQA